MYDFNREPIVALGGFINQNVCFYMPSSNRIQILQKKSYHYQNENKNQMIEMADNIFKQLFYYSKSLEKVNSKQQKLNVLDILLENIKRIVIFNGDKYGIIPEQRLFYLVLSYLHSKLHKKNDIRQFLNQVHWLLITANSDQQQQLPFAFTALLNGQFQQLLEYIKQKFCPYLPPSNLQNLIDMLIYKIQQSQSEQEDKDNKDKIYQKLKKTISVNERFNSLKKQLKDGAKKNTNISSIFQGDYELELIISILAGNQQIIQLVSKKSWAIYLNLYINYVQCIKNLTKNRSSYINMSTQFIKRTKGNNKKNNLNNNLSDQEIFLIQIIDTCSQNKTHSFHQIYQKSFNIFSPVLSHLLGTLMLQSRLVDLFSIFNNKDYYQQISLSLLESASEISWSSLVHMIGYLQHNQYFQQAPHMISLWESLLFKYLPYDLSSKHQLDIKTQIKQIQEKIQDLNMIGLKYITKSYLNTVFKLEINPKNSFNKLNPIILELFFMNLQIPDNNNANQCMHQMKIFMKNYYKNYQFDYRMIDNLQYLFEKKENILDKKTISKIHSLFKLIYKIGEIYSQTVIPIQVQNQLQQNNKVMNQIIKFNNLFSSDINKSITLCVQLLKLGKYLLEKILSQNLQGEQDNQTNMKIQIEQTENQTDEISKSQTIDRIIKNFKRNIIQYIKLWKYNTPENNNIFGEDALELLKYFHSYLY